MQDLDPKCRHFGILWHFGIFAKKSRIGNQIRFFRYFPIFRLFPTFRFHSSNFNSYMCIGWEFDLDFEKCILYVHCTITLWPSHRATVPIFSSSLLLILLLLPEEPETWVQSSIAVTLRISTRVVSGTPAILTTPTAAGAGKPARASRSWVKTTTVSPRIHLAGERKEGEAHVTGSIEVLYQLEAWKYSWQNKIMI